MKSFILKFAPVFIITLLVVAPVCAEECRTQSRTIQDLIAGKSVNLTREQKATCKEVRADHKEALKIVKESAAASKGLNTPLWTDAQIEQMAKEEAKNTPIKAPNMYFGTIYGPQGFTNANIFLY